jgi:hypothetical protein
MARSIRDRNTYLAGALIGLLGSAETITAKRRDEIIRKTDYGSFGDV